MHQNHGYKLGQAQTNEVLGHSSNKERSKNFDTIDWKLYSDYDVRGSQNNLNARNALSIWG